MSGFLTTASKSLDPSHETPEATLQAWRTRMHRVTDWWVHHLDQPFDLDRMAELAHFSPYHFHRVYTLVMNEPIAETLRRMRMRMRMRLHRAAVMLATPIKLFAIAKKAGYGRVQAVGRVFRAACRLRRGSRLFAFPLEKNPARW